MKQESGFDKTGHTVISTDADRQDDIVRAMTPDCLPPEESAKVPDVCKVSEHDTGVGGGVRQVSRRSKVKVVPLRQEDVAGAKVSGVRNRMMIIVVVALCIVLGFVIIKSKGPGADGQAKSPETAVTGGKESGRVTNASLAWKIPQLIKSARDITGAAADVPQLPDTPLLSDISVSGIIVYGNKSMAAIIDATLVKAGDVVDGVTVYKITQDSVVFEKDGVRWVRQVK